MSGSLEVWRLEGVETWRLLGLKELGDAVESWVEDEDMERQEEMKNRRWCDGYSEGVQILYV